MARRSYMSPIIVNDNVPMTSRASGQLNDLQYEITGNLKLGETLSSYRPKDRAQRVYQILVLIAVCMAGRLTGSEGSPHHLKRSFTCGRDLHTDTLKEA